MTVPLETAERPEGPPVIVAVPAVIDLVNADVVYAVLSGAVASDAPVIVADLSATAFCDAAGAHRLLMAGYQAAARGGRLRLVIPPGALVGRMLALLGVEHLLPVYSSTEDACSAGPAAVSKARTITGATGPSRVTAALGSSPLRGHEAGLADQRA